MAVSVSADLLLQVDFAEFTDRLTNLGTTPLANAYLQPMITQDLRL